MSDSFEANPTKEKIGDIARELSKTIQCQCDLDNWEPEKLTGHSCVCPIHNAAIKQGFNL